MDTKSILISQHEAALMMLRSAIGSCPDHLWDDGSQANRYWHIAYPALFYAHLYSNESEASHEAWSLARPEANFLGPLPWPPHALPEIGDPYSREELIAYADWLTPGLRRRIRRLSLRGPSGFPWLPFSRLELHIYSIRHIQHHAAQLIDRLRRAGGNGVGWVGRGQGTTT